MEGLRSSVILVFLVLIFSSSWSPSGVLLLCHWSIRILSHFPLLFQVSRPVPHVSVLVSPVPSRRVLLISYLLSVSSGEATFPLVRLFKAKSACRRSPFVSKTNDCSFFRYVVANGPGEPRKHQKETRGDWDRTEQDQTRLRLNWDQIGQRQERGGDGETWKRGSF